MSPGMGRAAFRIAFFVTLVSAVLMPFLKIGTAEFVVNVLSLGVGLVVSIVITVLARLT